MLRRVPRRPDFQRYRVLWFGLLLFDVWCGEILLGWRIFRCCGHECVKYVLTTDAQCQHGLSDLPHASRTFLYAMIWACSAMDLMRWHGKHTIMRLDGSSEPPTAWGTTWSASRAGPSMSPQRPHLHFCCRATPSLTHDGMCFLFFFFNDDMSILPTVD